MSPVITEFAVDFDEKAVETINPNPRSMPYILKNEPVCLFVAFKPGFEGETKLTLRYQDSLNKLPYEKSVTISSSSDAALAAVDKMVHHKELSILCEKAHDEKSLAEDIYLPKVKDLDNYIVNCSVRNQVLCQLTAFVCVGKAVGDAEGEKMKVQTATRVTIPQSQPIEYEEERMNRGDSRGGRGGRLTLMKKSKLTPPPMPMPMDHCFTTKMSSTKQLKTMNASKPMSNMASSASSSLMKTEAIQARRMVPEDECDIEYEMEDTTVFKKEKMERKREPAK